MRRILAIIAVIMVSAISLGAAAPEIDGAVNMTYSPDSSKVAYTRDNDLYVTDMVSGRETRLTFDGSDVILNGYASWVYYEEIFGRASRYKAFWWSPDSRRIGFYRFDNTQVPSFPIYSPFGQHGALNMTRYPKAGDPNPSVRIGIVDVDLAIASESPLWIIWAKFRQDPDQYFGTPFWGPDGREFFVSRIPRVQQELDLFAVSAETGSLKQIYHEQYPTWLDFMDGITFSEKGLYMARSFETGWEQIYFLSYDGLTLRRITDGTNWNVSIVRVEERKGNVYFTANRDSDVRTTLYKVDRRGRVTALTDTSYSVSGVEFSADGRTFDATLSNMRTPGRKVRVSVSDPRRITLISDNAPSDFAPSSLPLPEVMYMTTSDGFKLPAAISYPKEFDPSVRYPVVMEIYGGPGTEYVRDIWRDRNVTPMRKWFYENGFIYITADSAVSGHNGRAGTDMAYEDLHTRAISDFVEWARYLKSLPYVDGDHIGVEGFSFGGANTAKLIMEHSDCFHAGIAGGGVYDWMLYDSAYTERFMNTPANNPEGYAGCRVMDSAGKMTDGILKITHGTGDDNVHFQNTLQLVDALQKAGKQFELMIYPDGLHGYRGVQAAHSDEADKVFWTRTLRK